MTERRTMFKLRSNIARNNYRVQRNLNKPSERLNVKSVLSVPVYVYRSELIFEIWKLQRSWYKSCSSVIQYVDSRWLQQGDLCVITGLMIWHRPVLLASASTPAHFVQPDEMLTHTPQSLHSGWIEKQSIMTRNLDNRTVRLWHREPLLSATCIRENSENIVKVIRLSMHNAHQPQTFGLTITITRLPTSGVPIVDDRYPFSLSPLPFH